MKIIMFEGTPEEFSAAAPAFGASIGNANVVQVAPPPTPTETRVEDGRFVTSEEARKILTRLELSVPMRQVLIKLRLAGDEMLSSEELQGFTGHNADQFRGMMGAFGRRVTNTVGKNVWFFRKAWDGVAGQYKWSLSPGADQAMQLLRIGDKTPSMIP